MKRIFRIIVGLILILIGLFIVGFTILYATQGGSIWVAIGAVVGGLVVTFTGVRIALGDKLGDIFGDFLLSI
jgi:hypothetical protein